MKDASWPAEGMTRSYDLLCIVRLDTSRHSSLNLSQPARISATMTRRSISQHRPRIEDTQMRRGSTDEWVVVVAIHH